MPIIEPEFMELTQDLDVAAFWEENAQCRAFTTDKPRCALSFSPDDHWIFEFMDCLLYTSPSPRDRTRSRMPSSA